MAKCASCGERVLAKNAAVAFKRDNRPDKRSRPLFGCVSCVKNGEFQKVVNALPQHPFMIGKGVKVKVALQYPSLWGMNGVVMRQEWRKGISWSLVEFRKKAKFVSIRVPSDHLKAYNAPKSKKV
jgi:hypothetical protein